MFNPFYYMWNPMTGCCVGLIMKPVRVLTPLGIAATAAGKVLEPVITNHITIPAIRKIDQLTDGSITAVLTELAAAENAQQNRR